MGIIKLRAVYSFEEVKKTWRETAEVFKCDGRSLIFEVS